MEVTAVTRTRRRGDVPARWVLVCEKEKADERQDDEARLAHESVW
jgi:hypothetical protein